MRERGVEPRSRWTGEIVLRELSWLGEGWRRVPASVFCEGCRCSCRCHRRRRETRLGQSARHGPCRVRMLQASLGSISQDGALRGGRETSESRRDGRRLRLSARPERAFPILSMWGGRGTGMASMAFRLVMKPVLTPSQVAVGGATWV